MAVAHLPLHAGMIAKCPDALRVQPLRRLVHLGAGKAIDDAARSFVTRQEAEQLLLRLIPLDDFIADIGPVEGGGENTSRLKLQPFNDVVTGMRIGSRRQRHARNAGILFCQPAKFAIFRPEIMAPLRNTMCFVNRKQRDFRAPYEILEAWRDDALRCHIE